MINHRVMFSQFGVTLITMHISDGIIPVDIALAADALAIPALYLSGRRLRVDEIPKMGVFTAALFVISLIHFPLGPSSIHLCLFGLTGIIFKIRSVPILFTTLLFQALIFQHGGLISLGINTLFMSSGALLAALIWHFPALNAASRSLLAGFTAVMLPAFLIGLLFFLIHYGPGMMVFPMLYLPSAVIEAGLTLTIVLYIQKNRPEIIHEFSQIL